MDRIRRILSQSIEYLLKKILLFSLAISAVVGLSFIFTHGFSFNAYSDRLVWAGLFLFLLSGVVWLGVFTAGSQFGVPGMIKRPEEAKRYFSNQTAIRETVEKRYATAIQVWVIGLVCIGIGVLVQVIGSKVL
jgi:hypothetical protein